ncbi:hypothetical protein CRUP_034454 [Coryphaenoides rupestris]|nr:hypothetical protein CRUP_034454 [Coryphaenoides rupestris]
MATEQRCSPPPFPPDSEDQDQDQDQDQDHDHDHDQSDPPMADIMDSALPVISEPSKVLFEPPADLLETKPAVTEPLDEFDDLVDISDDVPSARAAAAGEKAAAALTTEPPSDELCEDFVDLSGSDSDLSQEEAALVELPADSAGASPGPQDASAALPPSDVPTGSGSTLIEVDISPFSSSSADDSAKQKPPANNLLFDPLAGGVAVVGPNPPVVVADAKKPAEPTPLDLFEDDPGDLFGEPRHAKPLPASLFGEADEDIFGEPLGTKKAPAPATTHREQREAVGITKTDSLGAGSAGGFGDVGGPLNNNYEKEPADIFSEEAVTIAPKASAPATSSRTNGLHGAAEERDLFTEDTVELSLDSPRTDRKKIATAAKPSTSASTLSSAAAADLSKTHSTSLEELEEEEQDDNFDVNISVTNPEKIGDGMNAYMAYRVSTQTALAMFRSKNFTVRRRFSDFLGLYEKLTDKHAPSGFIVPPPPEKSILGMTKVKVGKEDSSSAEFVERRRAALERYLQRVVCHPSLLQDPDVREFLEREELPRAVSTQALSGAGFLKMLNKATDAVSKMTIKMNESDVWFEEKLQEVEAADQQFRKLHSLVESLVVHRKELSANTACFSKSVAMLGSSEDNTALSRALSQLAEVEDKMEQLHQEQASCDSFCFAELIADYIRLLGSKWQDAQTMLQKKRESEAKLLWANKPEKLQQAKDEIAEWEAKVTQYEGDFDRVSTTVRKEVIRFEKEKVKNFKRQIIRYLESQLQAQQQLIKYWDAFLPEAKAIA